MLPRAGDFVLISLEHVLMLHRAVPAIDTDNKLLPARKASCILGPCPLRGVEPKRSLPLLVLNQKSNGRRFLTRHVAAMPFCAKRLNSCWRQAIPETRSRWRLALYR